MIAVFDSGLGGLTAVKELRAILPRENMVYFGDTARVPYGTRTPEIITSYAMQDIRFLLNFEPKAILAACGTVSSTAIDALRANFDLPILGVVEATARAAAVATRCGKVGIIGTATTIASGAYSRVLAEIDANIRITEVACPLFVPLVENGFTDPDDPITRMTCERYLAPIRDAGCDTLILGCTHYPIIAHHIAACLPGVRLINSGEQSALALRALLAERGLLNDDGDGSVDYYVSDNTAGFASGAALFLGEAVDTAVHRVDITKY